MSEQKKIPGIVMKSKMDITDWSVIEEKSYSYPFAFLIYMSSVSLQAWDTDCVLDPVEELLEARFFGSEGEMHLFLEEEGWKMVEILETEAAQYLEKTEPLAKDFTTSFQKITIRSYLDYDEDGQAYIAVSRLHGAQGGECL